MGPQTLDGRGTAFLYALHLSKSIGTHTVTAGLQRRDGNFSVSSGTLAGGQVVNKKQ